MAEAQTTVRLPHRLGCMACLSCLCLSPLRPPTHVVESHPECRFLWLWHSDSHRADEVQCRVSAKRPQTVDAFGGLLGHEILDCARRRPFACRPPHGGSLSVPVRSPAEAGVRFSTQAPHQTSTGLDKQDQTRQDQSTSGGRRKREAKDTGGRLMASRRIS
ncbi:hypothetical protein JDV02_010760 [Purpureocillium takamizusanense]|uniref:Uncharacterized protein n=1 Tax=Purpureocillium takamizusanense TaxID=2060973 RepID=A0A9Q8VHP9_9HYPO|nr:uncharacterized protein JDV02_010760 [Purpureocillium takamizusanense]UNI25052.1 hypothetical protein JDV02_010760 [Purpureocillium takamizusanense]